MGTSGQRYNQRERFSKNCFDRCMSDNYIDLNAQAAAYDGAKRVRTSIYNP